MKTTNILMMTITALLMLGWTTACQTNTATPNNSVNQTANNQPEVKTANDKQPETAKKEVSKPSGGSTATPTEAYKTAYAARQNKDVAGLKRILSKDILDFFAMMGEAENKTVDDELKQLVEKPQAATDESRNEKISGDRATLEYPDENGKWKTMDFIKEDGEWKMTVPNAKSPVLTDTSKKNK